MNVELVAELLMFDGVTWHLTAMFNTMADCEASMAFLMEVSVQHIISCTPVQ